MKPNKLIPELAVPNFEKSLNFYTKILGFKTEYQRKESKFAFLSIQKSQIMLEQINDSTWVTGKLKHPFGRGIHLQIHVKKLNPILKSLKKNKYPIFIEPYEKWYRKNKKLLGHRQFLVKDPDGYLLRFFEDIGTKRVER